MHQIVKKRLIIFATKFTNSLFMVFLIFGSLVTQDVFKPQDVFKLKSCTNAKISPDGKWIAYTVRVQREINDDAGGAYNELYLLSTMTGEIIPFICGKVNISSIKWSPDGSKIGFLTKRGEKEKIQIWAISINGGEALKLSDSKTGVLTFEWHPVENKIGYTAVHPKSKHIEELAKKGYEFIYYEENIEHRNLYLLDLANNNVEQLTKNRTVWDFVFSHDGKKIAVSVSHKNLIDHRYMFRKIYILDLEDKSLKQLSQNPGKLGNYIFSPDGSKLAYTAALTREDHQISQAYVIDVAGGETKNLTIPDFRGHVNWVGWKDDKTVIYRAGEGVWPILSAVSINGGKREIILNGKEAKIIFGEPDGDNTGSVFTMTGSSPFFLSDVFIWKQGEELKRLTILNPWLEEKSLGEQKVIKYKARDNTDIKGLLIYPAGYEPNKKYPLLFMYTVVLSTITIMHGLPLIPHQGRLCQEKNTLYFIQITG